MQGQPVEPLNLSPSRSAFPTLWLLVSVCMTWGCSPGVLSNRQDLNQTQRELDALADQLESAATAEMCANYQTLCQTAASICADLAGDQESAPGCADIQGRCSTNLAQYCSSLVFADGGVGSPDTGADADDGALTPDAALPDSAPPAPDAALPDSAPPAPDAAPAADSAPPQADAGMPPTGPLSFPIRAAFYYPWFPETWTVGGQHVSYLPTSGYYDSSDSGVVDEHIAALDYGKVQVSIASWWGPSTHKENQRLPLLLQRTLAASSPLKWALYYEKEGFGDPSVSALQSDLAYAATNYTSSAAYARVNGKPVIFVYNADDPDCSVADRWKQATGGQWYVVLKVMSGYRSCASQPDSWHQYAPAKAADEQNDFSYAISPGFWRADEPSPRLARDPSRWAQNVKDMVASGQPWQLITTFNEWGEGTAVESAAEWTSPSGHGAYLDALHLN